MFLWLILTVPPLLLGLWAQWRVRSAFKKGAQMSTSRGLSGAQIARQILDTAGLYDVGVERVGGFLSDHYDPRAKVLRLSPDVHDGRSLAAAGVAAHEAGHALQDKQGYPMLQLRSALVPTAQFGSWLGPILFMAGFFLTMLVGQGFLWLAWLGVIFFAGAALFSLVTLPVEFDASNRARQLLTSNGLVFQQEMNGVNMVLNAAALTYVAAAIQAIANLLYYVFLLVGLQNND